MSTMEVLRAKGANKPVPHRTKIPQDLANRISAVEAQLKERNLEIDWEAPVVKVLTSLVESAERDLRAHAGGEGGEAGKAGETPLQQAA